MEIRSYGEEAAPQLLEEENEIKGYGIVFDKESRVMYDSEKKRFFIEIIRSGAVTEEMLRQCDVKALLEHDRNRLLARCNNGEGSLNLTIDSYGCLYRFEIPDIPDGKFAKVMIKRGDLFGSSFAYITDEKNVTYTQRNGLLIRTVNKIDQIFDMSIVADPAYFGTDVTVRSISEIEAMLNPPKTDYKLELSKLRKLI